MTKLGDKREVHLNLKKIQNADTLLKLENPDYHIVKGKIKSEGQLAKCLIMLKTLLVKLNMSFETLIVKKMIDSLILYSILFEKLSKFEIFIRRKHFTILNATHNIKYLY